MGNIVLLISLSQFKEGSVSEQTSWINPNHDVPLDSMHRRLAKIRAQSDYEPPFTVVKRRVIDEQEGNECRFEATVSVKIKGREDLVLAAGSGRGPICSLEIALRKALIPHFQSIEKVVVTSCMSRTLPNSFEGLDADMEVILRIQNTKTGKISLISRVAISEPGACEAILVDFYELCCLADIREKELHC